MTFVNVRSVGEQEKANDVNSDEIKLKTCRRRHVFVKVDAGVSAQNGSNMTLSKSKGGIKEEVCLNDVI